MVLIRIKLEAEHNEMFNLDVCQETEFVPTTQKAAEITQASSTTTTTTATSTTTSTTTTGVESGLMLNDVTSFSNEEETEEIEEVQLQESQEGIEYEVEYVPEYEAEPEFTNTHTTVMPRIETLSMANDVAESKPAERIGKKNPYKIDAQKGRNTVFINGGRINGDKQAVEDTMFDLASMLAETVNIKILRSTITLHV